MGTYSQNVGGSEGGMVFVGRVPPGTSTGDVIWCDVLSDGHLAGGYNHPGDLRRCPLPSCNAIYRCFSAYIFSSWLVAG